MTCVTTICTYARSPLLRCRAASTVDGAAFDGILEAHNFDPIAIRVTMDSGMRGLGSRAETCCMYPISDGMPAIHFPDDRGYMAVDLAGGFVAPRTQTAMTPLAESATDTRAPNHDASRYCASATRIRRALSARSLASR